MLAPVINQAINQLIRVLIALGIATLIYHIKVFIISITTSIISIKYT